MTDEIYVKGPVLSPGMIGRPGMQDRALTAQEIQKAAYQYMNYSIIDVQHSFQKQADVVESYITPEPTVFNERNYPAGTWFITERVTNPTIIKAIENGELTGHSVGALPEKQYEDLKRINKAMFNDVKEGAWFPVAVSLVDIPFYEEMVFKVFGPDEFIKKSLDTEDKNMSDDGSRDSVIEMLVGAILKRDNKAPEYESGLETKIKELKDDVEKKDKEIKSLTKKLGKVEAELEEATKEPEPQDPEPEPEPPAEPAEPEPTPTEPVEPADPGEPITKGLPADPASKTKKSFMERIGRDGDGNKLRS